MEAEVVFYLDKKTNMRCQCFRVANKQALFWVGAHKYFIQDQTKVGKWILLQANIEGDKNAKYGLAIALLCESNDEGIQLLLSILNQPNGKQFMQNYRQILRNTIFGTNTFCIPKKPSMQEKWSGSLGSWMPLPMWKWRITCNMQNVLNWLGNVQIRQPSLVKIMFPKSIIQ